MNNFIYKYGKPDVHFDSEKVGSWVMANNRSLTDEHINKILDDPYEHQAKRKIMSNHDLSENQLDKQIEGTNSSDTLSMVSRQKNLSIGMANRLILKNSHTAIPLSYNQHLAQKYHAAGVLPHRFQTLRDLRSGSIEPHEVERMVTHGDEVIHSALSHNKRLLNSDHVSHILNKTKSNAVFDAMSSYEGLSDNNISSLIDRGDLDVTHTLAAYQPLKPHHIKDMITKFGDVVKDSLKFAGHLET